MAVHKKEEIENARVRQKMTATEDVDERIERPGRVLETEADVA